MYFSASGLQDYHKSMVTNALPSQFVFVPFSVCSRVRLLREDFANCRTYDHVLMISIYMIAVSSWVFMAVTDSYGDR